MQPTTMPSAIRPIALLLIVLTAALSFPTDKPGTTTSERSASTAASETHAPRTDAVPKDSVAQQSSITEVELMTGDEADGEEVEDDTQSEGQHFFPSFAPLFSGSPLAHSRPHLYEEQPRGFTDNYRSLYPSEETERVLGSGNFGVLRGGTYYTGSQDEDDELEPSYYRNNGHGRPPYYRANPQPAYRHGGDFFAGFRDFADITTPPKSAYSEYYVVYANKNGTGPSVPGSAPKNIIEQLQLLDAAEKISKRKQKLGEYKDKAESIENKKKNKSPKDLYEPLLALS